MGSVTAVRDSPTEQCLRRRTGQAHCHDAFQREVGSLPIMTTVEEPRIGFDGDSNDRNAVGDGRRTVSGFMISGTF